MQSGDKDSYQSWTQTFEQYNITAGVTYFPFLQQNSPFLFSIHGFAGLSEYMVKDATNGYGSNTYHYSSFTFNIGAEEQYQVTKNLGIGLQLAYASTYFNKNTQNNLRASLLANFRFKTKMTRK